MSKQNNLKERILSAVKNSQQKNLEMNALAEALDMTASDAYQNVVKGVAALERENKLHLNDDGTFSLTSEDGIYEGVFSASGRGFGFVSVEGFDDDFFIPPPVTNHAMHRDVVKLKQTKEAQPWNGKGPEGAIEEIVERNVTSLVGEFTAYDEQEVKKTGLYGYVEPQDKKMDNHIIYIETQGVKPKNGSIVLIEITKYPTDDNPKTLFGLVTTEIGHKNEPGVDILSVVYDHGIPQEFSPATYEELDEIPDEVRAEDLEGRKDLRDLQTITIDGADAKDLDDAISAKRLDSGNIQLGVHIADVSHYVREGSAIDEDAFTRGTSVYLTDRVIPMLPQKLSNGICSLNPRVDRLTLSCEMEINSHGEVVRYEIGPSVIYSNQRFTYAEVNSILEDEDKELRSKYSDYIEMLETMAELHEILENKRVARGAISFDTDEAEIIVDEEGHPTDILLRERRVGERMIESFMLTANETVSEHYNKRNLPILYRVHENPDEEKVQSFLEFAGTLGIQVKAKKENITPKQMQTVIDEVEGKPEETVVTMTLLRSMQQARYDVESLGHFGLAAEYYSHFTSPIRRYPDLILHRLIHYYDEIGQSAQDKGYWESELPEIAEHSSVAERRAIDAERDVDAMKKVEYMADKVGNTYDAVIVSVLGFGMFIQLENTVEGLIHISNMNEDYFEFNEQAMMLVGQNTGVKYRVGEPVRVKLTNANLEQNELDFELVFDEDEEEKPEKSFKSKSSRDEKGKKRDHSFKIKRKK